MESKRIGGITAFATAVKAGSFSAAALVMGQTRSAVSKSVFRLEARLGVRLLNRSTRTFSLTDEGALAYERWRQILDDLDEVEATMASRQGRPTGTLKMTAPLSFGQLHVLPVLQDYLNQWPELKLHLSFTDRYVDLIEEGFDLAVRIGGTREDSELLSRSIAVQQFVVCASPAYLASAGTPQEPEDLARHDRIVFLTNNLPRQWQFDGPSGSQTIDGAGRVNVDNADAMRVCALSSLGLAHLPTYVVKKDLEAGALKEVLEPYRATPDPIQVLFPSKRHLSPRVREFIDLLAARWEDCLPWTCDSV